MLYCAIVYFMFLFILVWEGKIQKNSDEKQLLKSLNAFRGILAMEIIVGHVIRDDATLLYPLGKFMICSVAFFFFVSAFGMSLSYKNKKNYLNTAFLIGKPLYLVLLAVGVFAVNALVDLAVPGDQGYVLLPTPAAIFSGTNWYIWEMIAFYILFWLTYRYLPKYRITIITAVTVIGTVLMYHFIGPSGIAWVASAYAFPLGLLFGEHYAAVRKFIHSPAGVLVTAVLAIVGGLSLILPTETFLTIVIMRNAICIAFILIMVYICERVSLANNVIARWLTRLSTELYLAQFVCLIISEQFGWGYMFRIPFVVIATVLLAVCVLHPLVILLTRLTGRPSKTSGQFTKS